MSRKWSENKRFGSCTWMKSPKITFLFRLHKINCPTEIVPITDLEHIVFNALYLQEVAASCNSDMYDDTNFLPWKEQIPMEIIHNSLWMSNNVANNFSCSLVLNLFWMEIHIPCKLTKKFFLIKFLADTYACPFFVATGTPVLDFWLHLLWGSKPEWVLPYLLFVEANVMYIPWDPPLVLHAPTSWQLVHRQSCPHTLFQRWGCRDSNSCSQNICESDALPTELSRDRQLTKN